VTPEEEEQVSRALRSLPPVGPVPADLATRLDATLADLVAERADAPAEKPTRRRRRLPTLVVAAASVAVVALGLGVVNETMQGSGEDQSASDTAAGGSAEAETAPGPTTLSQDDADAAGKAPGRLSAVRLRAAHLERDVRRAVLLAGVDAQRAMADTEPNTLGEDGEVPPQRRAVARCVLPDTAPGDRLVAVRLDGARGTLVLRAEKDGVHVAEVYACDDVAEPLAMTRVDEVRTGR
jgi:hypothetical protein